MGERELDGLRVLVVEDEPLIAMLIEDVLESAGCEIVGPMAQLATGMKAVCAGGFDVAVLDVNVNGKPTFPLAAMLSDKGIPFLFVTGYAPADIIAEFRDRAVLRKPFRTSQLVASIRAIADAAASGS